MRRTTFLPALVLMMIGSAAAATAQSTQPAGPANPQSMGKPETPANQGMSNGQNTSGSMSSGTPAMGSPDMAASGSRGKMKRQPMAKKQGAVDTSSDMNASPSADGTRPSDTIG